MSQTVIEVRNLTKEYKDTTAVDHVSFRIEENKIYGLLGRNGAGKTTIMQMITAQLFSTSGEVRVFGEHPYENKKVIQQICFIKEGQKYPDLFTVKDVMVTASSVYPNWDAEYAKALIEVFRLPMKRLIKRLSRGMLSSVGIIVGLASRAPITIFDEPYLGLDAVARELFYDHLIEDYTENPRTIILSTHLIDEVSRLLEHLIVIDSGKILLDTDTDELRGRTHNVIGHQSAVESFIKGRDVIHLESLGSTLSATVMGRTETEVKQAAEQAGLETAPVSLQQLIVHLTKNGKVASR
ncbi:ABC transporter ATP-binding protein [Paenibacillus glucanolyticus]|jgi:ABC-2 type transport system ATP-binding protein|uniref:ABC transporter ATP-binding protein n=1 Tax=Paenibacillus TaxID=44249 RepID=UPI0003E23C09|nr:MULTISPECIES: ABC transporter ATP-binding protein [Paenibacillus]ANA82810.1 ABC transporter ATP-binding protein [Paenibacillus glucanolyticus]AVV58106.1 ABC transporter ATP-binding protein [Paenibacillus glucanolyticus]ETT42852.1 ABC transporter-like protein [Paenibacillus sp. FSL R5-808]